MVQSFKEKIMKSVFPELFKDCIQQVCYEKIIYIFSQVFANKLILDKIKDNMYYCRISS
jgi:hypothetical protein